MMDASSQAELDAALQGLFRRHRGSLTQQVADIEDAVAAALGGALDEPAAEFARRQAHKLSGAGGMFGLHRTSELARELEAEFGTPRPTEQAWVHRVAELTVDLAESMESEAPTAGSDDGPGDGPDDSRPTLLVALAEDAFRTTVVNQARDRGLRVRVMEGDDDLKAASRPDVALLGAAAVGDPPGLQRVLGRLSTGPDPVPTIVMANGEDRVDRVEIARAGARGFLTTPIDASRAVDAVQELLEDHRLDGITIVAVDDDPAVLAVIERLLGNQGVRVETVADPDSFWGVLNRARPDLLILDVDMPGISGIELCRVVRSDPAWTHVSILFLTGHRDVETVTQVFEAGADDYVAKPLNHRELVVRITNRLDRIRLSRHLVEVDPLTGAASRARTHDVFDQFARRADRYGEPLAVAVLDLDDFKAVNVRHGHTAGDRVLRALGTRLLEAFPPGDLVARWSGQEFLVAMPGMARSDGVDRIAQVLEQHRETGHSSGAGRFSCSFTAGVAQYPLDGTDLHGLYLAADQALQAARTVGGNRVFPTGRATTDDQQTHDIVVVEDDATMASVLAHGLETRGWSSYRIEDGNRGLELLTGDSPELSARVIVLDWDLPGVDGPTLLAQLRNEGILHRTRVIMLTAHAQEADVLRTLELGAFDHVAKPFSVPVLMQRIRMALAN